MNIQQVFLHLSEIAITGKNGAIEIEGQAITENHSFPEQKWARRTSIESAQHGANLNLDLGIAEGAVRSLEVENQDKCFLNECLIP